jgi:cyclopropane fatty-acyl-phospholipid synthase-like methyltransferase
VGLGFGTHGWLPEQGRALRPTTERLLRAAGVTEGMTVLDIYCGPGEVAMMAADRVGHGGHVIGIDPRAEAADAPKHVLRQRATRTSSIGRLIWPMSGCPHRASMRCYAGMS